MTFVHNPARYYLIGFSAVPGFKFVCNICGETSTSMLGCQIHKARRHSIPYANDKDRFKIPVQTFEGLSYFCYTCPKKFATLIAVTRHQRRHKEKTIQCALCPMRFIYPNELSLHTASSHVKNPPTYHCKFCRKKFKTLHGLRMHEMAHSLKNRLKCNRCDSSFGSKVALENHVKVTHEGMRNICATCGQVFSSTGYFKRHVKTHDPDYVASTFVCQYCDKVLTGSKYNFKRHVDKHRGCAKTHFCNICDKHLNSSTSLKQHFAMHTGEKNCICETCGKAFTDKRYLIVHRRVHTKEKPYACSTCSRKFTQKGSLRVHMRLHTGEKPFQCTACTKKFLTKSLLNVHKCLV